MNPGETYVSKFTVCNDDARYIVLLKEYLGDDLWSCELGILQDNHPSAEFKDWMTPDTIKGKTLFSKYEKIN